MLAHTYRIRTTENNFGFGLETGRIAYSLANGMGFSSPFGGNTGPSAWTAPVYPWIVSLAFRVFGSYSQASAFVMLSFNSVFAALTSWTIYRTARRIFNPTVAIWSGWVWALYPDTIFWSVKWIWETSLSAFLLSLLFMLTVEMEGDERLSSWIGYGLLWGIEALTNPAALAFLPFAGCWLAYQLHRRGKRYLRTRRAKRHRLLDGDHAVAGARLRVSWDISCSDPRQRRQRVPDRQQPACRRSVRTGLSSQPERACCWPSTGGWASLLSAPTRAAWQNNGLPSIPENSQSSPCAAFIISGTAYPGWRNRQWLAELKNSHICFCLCWAFGDCCWPSSAGFTASFCSPV